MNFIQLVRAALLVAVVTFSLFAPSSNASAGEYLIGDRLSSRVLRYSESGDFLGELINDPVNLPLVGGQLGIAGITVSPDHTKLYVTSQGISSVVEYNYNGATATFSKLISGISAAPSTIAAPAAVLFSPDASKMYVSNFGFLADGSTVAQLNADGTSAGPDLTGGPANGRSGLAWSPSGDLLVSSYGFSPAGGVLRYDSGAGSFVDLIAPVVELRGAANLLVQGDDLYVLAGFGGRLGRFDANTGALDATFGTNGYVGGLTFPGSIGAATDGQSLLAGILGATNGSGRIDRYDLDGNPLGLFASNSNADPALGFREPTAIAYVASTIVPEPGSIALGLCGMVLASFYVGRAGRR